MNATISFPKFRTCLGAVYVYRDEKQFVRVWGHLVDETERTLTFWRHEANSPWVFKYLDTYVIPVSLAEKEDEKMERGYTEASMRSAAGIGLLREIHAAYIEAVRNENFHCSVVKQSN